MRSYVPLNEGIGGKGQQAKRHHKKEAPEKKKKNRSTAIQNSTLSTTAIIRNQTRQSNYWLNINTPKKPHKKSKTESRGSEGLADM